MPRMSRRDLAAFAAAIGVAAAARRGDAAEATPRLSIADLPGSAVNQARNEAQRFAFYRDLGFPMLRCLTGWADFNEAKGWAPEPHRLAYFNTAAQSGLKLKLEVSAAALAPGGFFAAHPDAQLRDATGRVAPHLISPWYPGVADLLRETQERMMASLDRAGVLANVACFVAGAGPAGEPIYPAAWEVHGAPLTFWCYDRNAQARFGPDMKARYHDDLAKANAAWGTSHRSWSDVVLPQPGAAPGGLWGDVLAWYRDAKRAMVAGIVRDTCELAKRHAPSAPVFLLIPGTHLSAEQWRKAVETGAGDGGIKVMIDTDFLLDLAAKTGTWLQYTAGGKSPEIRYIQDGMRRRHLTVPLWLENDGGPAALHPEQVVDAILANHLGGFDYINGKTLVGPDLLTPTDFAPVLRAQVARLRRGLG